MLPSVDKNRHLKPFFDDNNVSWMESRIERLEKFHKLEKIEKTEKNLENATCSGS